MRFIRAKSLISSRYTFVATTFAFFLAEIGDKTQVATVLLATRYEPLWQVVLGTTAGMLLANVPVVLSIHVLRITSVIVLMSVGLKLMGGKS